MGSLTSQALGNLTSDIELKMTGSGKPFASFTVAVNHDRDTTSFVRCASWGKTAEIIAKHFSKGEPIFVSGTSKINEWSDRDGNKRKEFELQVKDFSFVSKPREQDRPLGKNEALEIAGDFVPRDEDADKPIDLSEIPF